MSATDIPPLNGIAVFAEGEAVFVRVGNGLQELTIAIPPHKACSLSTDLLRESLVAIDAYKKEGGDTARKEDE